MKVLRLALMLLLTIAIFFTTCHPSTDSELLLRRRRYVVFPEGSTFSIAFCVTWQLLRETSIFTLGLNWAVSYELPNQTIRNPETHRIEPPLLRRHRRELYQRLEVAINKSGLDGRTCIKRALCEAAVRLKPGASIGEEILRVLFSLPLEPVDLYEPLLHHVYDAAHRRGLGKANCGQKYQKCPFSLIDVLLIGPN
ncbi:hypothetical protein C0J52_21306 [Blattella germanica]|nr:hypothetical protein C0J52_21306 [Blattella germanica]